MKRLFLSIRSFVFTFLMLLLGICSGCSDNRNPEDHPVDKVAAITFSVSLPATEKAKTYALADADENNVGHIHVFAFGWSGTDYTLADWSEGKAIQDNGSNSKKKFTVTFTRLTAGNSYKFVLLANAQKEIDALPAGSLAVGAKKDLLLQQLQVNVSRWNTVPSDNDYRDIPMWGETPSQDGTGDKKLAANMNVTGLSLLRMVACINVTVDSSASGDFKLTSVSLYNPHGKGRMVPDIANLTPGSTSQVTKPTVVVKSKDNASPGFAVDYDASTPGSTLTATGCRRMIYTLESDVPRDNTGQVIAGQLTCLVIGGTYGADTNPTYYRVNLTHKDNGQYLDLLRNHRYSVKITKVGGRGYADKTEAFNAKAVNMSYETVVWNDAKAGDIISDGQYVLNVYPGSDFTFYRENGLQLVDVSTDYPGGWTITKITESNGTTLIPANGWLTSNIAANVAQGSDGSTVHLTLTVAENSSGASRTGYVYLRFGRTETRLTVTQNSTATVASIVTSVDGVPASGILFNGTDSKPKTIDIDWVPRNADLNIANTTIGVTAFPSASGIPSNGTVVSAGNGGTGKKSYTIIPSAFTDTELADNPFLEKASLLNFSCNGVTRPFFVRQINYTVSPLGIESSYQLTGNADTHSFSIRSNTYWRIKSVNESTGSGSLLALKATDLKVGTSGGIDQGSGTPLTFTVKKDNLTKGTVTLVFESTDPFKKFNDVSVVLKLSGGYYPNPHKGWAGSNIYWDGSKLTFDDVGVTTHQTYQGVYFQWGGIYGFSPVGEYVVSSTLFYSVFKGGMSSASPWNSWNMAPRVGDQVIDNSGATPHARQYLYEIYKIDSETGDICRLLTDYRHAPGSPAKKWRMPTAAEFQTAFNNWTINNWTSGTNKPATADGTASIASGSSNSETGTPFFPASGFRKPDGSLYSVGSDGYYWSGTPAYSAASYLLQFNKRIIYMSMEGARSRGMPVRCVLE